MKLRLINSYAGYPAGSVYAAEPALAAQLLGAMRAVPLPDGAVAANENEVEDKAVVRPAHKALFGPKRKR